MARAYFSCVIPADVEDVWAVLGSFHGLSSWIGKIVTDTPEGGSGRGPVGSLRRLELTDGRTVKEQLVAHDERRRQYSYEFGPGPLPFPVRTYRATIHALPVVTDGTTFVEWYGDFDADADIEDAMAAAFISRYREFCGDLAVYLAARTS